MISVEYCQLEARYSRWMNERLFAVARELPDDQRKRDRGAFFGSIHRTLNHLLWADRTWLGRFTGAPYGVAAYGADTYEDFDALARERDAADAAILAWAGALSPAWLAATLSYRAASDGKQRELPGWIAGAHFFQHAIHHRGQVGTLLKQAGKDVGVTDLPYLPGVTRVL
ncbi:MAG: DinB family protein [Betaproteobacteria bacterium]